MEAAARNRKTANLNDFANWFSKISTSKNKRSALPTTMIFRITCGKVWRKVRVSAIHGCRHTAHVSDAGRRIHVNLRNDRSANTVGRGAGEVRFDVNIQKSLSDSRQKFLNFVIEKTD